MSDPIEELAELFAGAGSRAYLGEAVSQAAHMLQAGTLAEQAGAADHVVAAALLHDVGHVVAEDGRPHEQAGADWLSQWFPKDVTEPIRLHVAAKRYLCAVEPGYFGQLSNASVESLALQGGPMSPDEAGAFEQLDAAQDAVAVRRWDEAAKDPTAHFADFEHFSGILEGLVRRRGLTNPPSA
jgi:gamma-butyrobetaine dioxygenase